MEALRTLARGRTTIFVAHRLSTIMHCDEIVVLDRGSVAERGSHSALLEAGGLYSQMWAAQQQRRTGAAAAGEEDEGIGGEAMSGAADSK